ncbi:MAG: hypothetical protein Ta2F_10150 [Termitinemataceae bacterium]|nr:MAG: hypothetical protein Ta2F_10150 [Termitinemataceae bacterium]
MSSKELTKTGVDAVFGIAGGAVLLVSSVIIGRLLPHASFIIGAVISVFGISGIFSKIKSDRKTGLAILLVGLVFMSSFVIKPVAAIAGTLLSIGAFASLGLGIWKGIRFLGGLKKLSR